MSLRLENDYQGQSEGILFIPITKTVTKLDGLKQQSSNFTEMTLGHYVSI